MAMFAWPRRDDDVRCSSSQVPRQLLTMSEESPHSPPHSPVSPEEDPLSVPAAVETRAEPAEATEETGPGVAEKEPEAQPAGAKDAPETEEKPVEKESALPEIPEGSPASDAPPPSPPAKEAPESSQVVDEALAQLVSMGYDAADASVAVAQVAGMFDGTAGVPVEALVDGAVAILSGQPAFASGGSPRRQINGELKVWCRNFFYISSPDYLLDS